MWGLVSSGFDEHIWSGKPSWYVISHPAQFSQVISSRLGVVNASKSWVINRHVMQCAFMVSQRKLVSRLGLQQRRDHHCPMGPMWLGQDFTLHFYVTCVEVYVDILVEQQCYVWQQRWYIVQCVCFWCVYVEIDGQQCMLEILDTAGTVSLTCSVVSLSDWNRDVSWTPEKSHSNVLMGHYWVLTKSQLRQKSSLCITCPQQGRQIEVG